MNSFYRHILLLVALSVNCMAFSANSLKQNLDSAYLLMGKKTTLNVELLVDGPLKGQLLFQDYPEEVELTDEGAGDTISHGNNRYELRRQLTLQSFDSGMYSLPPVLYVDGKDTLRSAALALKVIPVPVDSLTDIHDYADVVDPDSRWSDILPNWLVKYWFWILLAAVAIGVGIWLLIRAQRAKTHPVVVVTKPIPPYELAMKLLNELREEHLCENGREREFYTRLTEILRQYLHSRFGINAMEMTTRQILNALQHNDETRMSRTMMNQVLEMADFVKFAKARPLPDDNAKIYRNAVEFVETTRPKPQPEAENDAENAKNVNKQ